MRYWQWYVLKLAPWQFIPTRLTQEQALAAIRGELRLGDEQVQGIIGPFDRRNEIRKHFQIARRHGCSLSGPSR